MRPLILNCTSTLYYKHFTHTCTSTFTLALTPSDGSEITEEKEEKKTVLKSQTMWCADNVLRRRSAGNIISQGFLMAEDLNGYFSSVFTKEDISSLPVADAKFQGAKSDYLGPLVVTPELVAKKIRIGS